MWMSAYAPGDGSIDLVWVSDQNRNGEVLDEPVTESDASEFLRLPENEERWKGWEVIQFPGPGKRPESAQVRLFQPVTRPFHTSKQLRLNGEVYDYV